MSLAPPGEWVARRSTAVITAVFAIAVAAEPLRVAYESTLVAAFRDHDEVYASMMNGPMVLVLPLVAVLLTCLPLFQRLRARHVANMRARVSARRLVVLQLGRVAIIAGGAFFLHAFVAFMVAHVVWPWLGDPAIDPAGVNLPPAEARLDVLGRSSYSFLVAHGHFTFGVLYAAWIGAAAAAYATLGACMLFLLPNRILALSIPFLVYATGTTASAFLESPQTGLMNSLFPFGLAAGHPLEAAASTLIVILGTAAVAVLVIVRAPTNPRLS